MTLRCAFTTKSNQTEDIEPAAKTSWDGTDLTRCGNGGASLAERKMGYEVMSIDVIDAMNSLWLRPESPNR